MRPHGRTATSFVASGAAALVLLATSSALLQDDVEPMCVRVEAESRLGYPGWDHVVHLDNDCGGDASCEVATNLDPEPITVMAPAADHTAVVVRRGSPQRDFVPRVACVVITSHVIEGPAQPR